MLARARLLSCLGAFAAAPPGEAAIAFVQQVPQFKTTDGGVAKSSPFSLNPLVGNTIVVLTWSYTDNSLSGSTLLSATDTFGNTYTTHVWVAGTHVFGGGLNGYYDAAILSAQVVKTDAGFMVRAKSQAGSWQIEAVAMEYSVLGSLDQVGSGSGTSGSPSLSMSLSTGVPTTRGWLTRERPTPASRMEASTTAARRFPVPRPGPWNTARWAVGARSPVLQARCSWRSCSGFAGRARSRTRWSAQDSHQPPGQPVQGRRESACKARRGPERILPRGGGRGSGLSAEGLAGWRSRTRSCRTFRGA